MALFKGKKGGFLDWFYILAILFMTVICIVVAMVVINTVNNTQVFASDSHAQAAIDHTRSSILSFDNLMLFTIVGLSIFVLVSSALVYNHPAFFIVGFVLLCIAVVVAATMSNTYWSFSNQGTIAPTIASFPKIDFLMLHLPFYIAFMGVMAAIVMYVAYQRQ